MSLPRLHLGGCASASSQLQRRNGLSHGRLGQLACRAAPLRKRTTTTATTATRAPDALGLCHTPHASTTLPFRSPVSRQPAAHPAPPASCCHHHRSSSNHPSRRTIAAAAAAAAATTAAPAAAAAAAGAVAATATAAAATSSWMDLFAVLLGYACLLGSCFRSVPQIAIILRTGSAEGLSLTSNLMELLCFTVSVAYNIQQGYAFNTYGEVFACWIQDAVIVGLIFRHMRLGAPSVVAATAAFGACCAWLFSPLCPMQVLSALQLSTIVVMAVGARLPQIWLNMRRGDAGVLSPLTCLLNVAGCVVRIFTTVVLTRDVIILGGCVTQLILNAILLYQSVVTPGIVREPAAATPAAATATATATAASAAAAAAAAAAIAATDPPTGGVGSEARGQAAAAVREEGDGEGGSGSGGGGSLVPAAA